MSKKIVFDFSGKKKAKKNLKMGITAGAAIGTFIGALGGILLAPKSGKETREDIKKGVETAAKKAGQDVKEMGSKMGQEVRKMFKKKQAAETTDIQAEEETQIKSADEAMNCDTCKEASSCVEDQEVK